jgi:hypothetical protein
MNVPVPVAVTGRPWDRVAADLAAAAHRLGLLHSTVKHYLANARSKVGATTTAQLVSIQAPRLPEPEGEARRRSSLAAQTPACSQLDRRRIAGRERIHPDLAWHAVA